MKVAVSIPDDVYNETEAYVRRVKLPRSRVYAEALKSYVHGKSSDPVTDAMNAAIDFAGFGETAEAADRISCDILRTVEW